MPIVLDKTFWLFGSALDGPREIQKTKIQHTSNARCTLPRVASHLPVASFAWPSQIGAESLCNLAVLSPLAVNIPNGTLFNIVGATQ